jgi:hypothetical protein
VPVSPVTTAIPDLTFVVKTKRPLGFLNVDLEIEASVPLDALAVEMGEAVLVMHSGPSEGNGHLLCLESSGRSDTPDDTARALCRAVEQLSTNGRKLWDTADKKHFDAGYQIPIEARSVHGALEIKTLERIVALGATVAFSCYRSDDSESSG